MKYSDEEEVLDGLVRVAEGAAEALKNRHLPSTLHDNLTYVVANATSVLKALEESAAAAREPSWATRISRLLHQEQLVDAPPEAIVSTVVAPTAHDNRSGGNSDD